VFSCKQCERRERQVLKILIQALCDVAQFQLENGDIPQENIFDNFRIEEWKNYGFKFTKNGKLCLIYQIVTANIQIKKNFVIPPFSIKKSLSYFETYLIFRNFFGTSDL
jgi:hypothetical protein